MDVSRLTKKDIENIRAKEYVKGLDTLQTLELYYNSDIDIPLTPSQEIRRQQIDLIIRLELKGLPTSAIVSRLSKIKEWKLQQRKIYTLLKQAKVLYGKIHVKEPLLLFHKVEQMALRNYKTASRNGEIKEMNAAVKILLDLAKSLDTATEIDFEKMKQSLLVMVLDESIRTQLMNIINNNGSIDLNNFLQNINEAAEDIEFIEANE